VTVLRKIVALIALLAAAVLLFVVVCPITPTPTAVITSRNTAPLATISVALAAILPSLALLTATVSQIQWITDVREIPAPLTVLKRTCVRLC
jgi:hypothetical protein